MTTDAGLPLGFWARIEKMIDERVARYARSAPVRNVSMTSGDFRVQGGRFRIQYPADQGGADAVYFGDLSKSDGSRSGSGMVVQGPDGRNILQAYAAPSGQTIAQITDNFGNVVIESEATGTGGLNRPFLTQAFYPARWADLTVSTTSATFETLFQGAFYKQHPALSVVARAATDASTTTGELRVLVNGVPLGSVLTIDNVLANRFFYGELADPHMTWQLVEIQGRRTSAAGSMRVAPLTMYGRGDTTSITT